MARDLSRNVGSMAYDKLIAGITPSAQVASGTIEKLSAAASYVRGTVFARSTLDNKLSILGTAPAKTTVKKSGNGTAKAFTLTDAPEVIRQVVIRGNTEQDTGDGTTKDFILTATPLEIASVTIGGVATTAYTYDAATHTVSFTTAPANAAAIVYTFPLVITTYVWDRSSKRITFDSAPASATDNIEITYDAEQLVPDCILIEDITVGTAEDAVAAVFTAGLFNKDALTVKAAYTMTQADKDKLRERGIILTEVWPE